MRKLLILLVMIVFGAATAPILSAGDSQKKGPSTRSSKKDSGWRKVKSSTGTAKSKATAVKFLITSQHWRLSLDTDRGGDTPGERIRAALMLENSRDIDDQPQAWQQLEVLLDGEPGKDINKEFDNGLDKNNKPRWFEIVITGHRAHYKILVEDQGEAPPK